MQIQFSQTKVDYFKDLNISQTATLGASNFSGCMMPSLQDFITSINEKSVNVENRPTSQSKSRGRKRKRYLSVPISLNIDGEEYTLDTRDNEILQFIVKVLRSWLCSEDGKIVGVKQPSPVRVIGAIVADNILFYIIIYFQGASG